MVIENRIPQQNRGIMLQTFLHDASLTTLPSVQMKRRLSHPVSWVDCLFTRFNGIFASGLMGYLHL